MRKYIFSIFSSIQNAKETCNVLGVKHHEVSLPNHAHLQSFKAFFKAWIESEEPVAAAMTCVACKHLHLLGIRLAKERQIPMLVWSMCPLEVPPFIPTQAKHETKVASNGIAGLSFLLGKNILAQKKKIDKPLLKILQRVYLDVYLLGRILNSYKFCIQR